MSEHEQQVTVVSWFKVKYPKYAKCIMSIPNSQMMLKYPRERARVMNYLKREGFKKGVSDLFIAVPRKGKHGLWVEMKDVKKTLRSVNPEQIAHLNLMVKMGYEGIWCAGADVAMAAIETYMSEDH